MDNHDSNSNSPFEVNVTGSEGMEQYQYQVDIEWKQFDFLSALSGLYTSSVERRKCKLGVFVQGDINNLVDKVVVLTVHDVGKSHLCFVDYVNSPAMASLRERAVFLHICVPGQEPGSPLFTGSFPSMEQLGDALAQVLHNFKVTSCFAVGEGAGADICCRFAMDFPEIVKGLVLVHCTSTPHGIVGHIKEILASLRIDDGDMTNAAWNYLLTHRFGNHNMDEQQKHYVDLLKAAMNVRNLSRFLYSFSHRTDFTDKLKEQMAKYDFRVDVLMVTGGKAPHNENVMHMFKNLNEEHTGVIMVEGVMDVLEEAPDNVTSALILLTQRHGFLTDLSLPIIKQREHEHPDQQRGAVAQHSTVVQGNDFGMGGMPDLAFQA